MSLDVCVIGGGLAGCAAALAAAQAGARVMVVNHAPGTTAMHTGVFDIDADQARIKKLPVPENGDLAQNVHSMLAANPRHAYARLGDDPAGAVREAAEFTTARLSGAGLPLAFTTDRWMLLPTQLGTLRRARLCLDTMAPGDLFQMKNANLLLIGAAGLDGFRPAAAAALIKSLADRVSPGLVGECAGVSLAPPAGAQTPNLSPFHFAQLMDRADARGEFLERTAAAAKERGATHAAFPAAMGAERAAETLEAARAALGIPCFELAAAPPCVSGLRLETALAAALRQADVPVLKGRAAAFRAGDGDIFSITVQTPHGEQAVEASAFVLATGKFTSGGLARGEELAECLFDLPVFCGDRPARGMFLVDLTTPQFADKQPIFSCGLRADFRHRPADERGRRVWRNLFAAGSVLGGYDPFRDRCGSGVALATGLAAGRAAAMSVKGEQR